MARTVKPGPRLCSGCGASFDQWQEWGHPGSAAVMCQPCYLTSVRERQRRRAEATRPDNTSGICEDCSRVFARKDRRRKRCESCSDKRRARRGRGRQKVKPAHYRGTYHVEARQVREAAYANPSTRCWRCGLTLAEHPRHKTGRPAHWTAGHLVDGQPGGPLLPEASTCNYAAGAGQGNRRRRKPQPNVSRSW